MCGTSSAFKGVHLKRFSSGGEGTWPACQRKQGMGLCSPELLTSLAYLLSFAQGVYFQKRQEAGKGELQLWAVGIRQ